MFCRHTILLCIKIKNYNRTKLHFLFLRFLTCKLCHPFIVCPIHPHFALKMIIRHFSSKIKKHKTRLDSRFKIPLILSQKIKSKFQFQTGNPKWGSISFNFLRKVPYNHFKTKMRVTWVKMNAWYNLQFKK